MPEQHVDVAVRQATILDLDISFLRESKKEGHAPGGSVLNSDFLLPPRFCVSFRIARIIEQDRQLDAAMAGLRKACRAAITRIEIGRRIIRRKKNQRIEKRL